MELEGFLIDNLDAAQASARRLRGRPVYKETLAYWSELVQEARRSRAGPSCRESDELDAAIVRLESELAQRPD